MKDKVYAASRNASENMLDYHDLTPGKLYKVFDIVKTNGIVTQFLVRDDDNDLMWISKSLFVGPLKARCTTKSIPSLDFGCTYDLVDFTYEGYCIRDEHGKREWFAIHNFDLIGGEEDMNEDNEYKSPYELHLRESETKKTRNRKTSSVFNMAQEIVKEKIYEEPQEKPLKFNVGDWVRKDEVVEGFILEVIDITSRYVFDKHAANIYVTKSPNEEIIGKALKINFDDLDKMEDETSVCKSEAYLLNMIDIALDIRDNQSFDELTENLKKLKGGIKWKGKTANNIV